MASEFEVKIEVSGGPDVGAAVLSSLKSLIPEVKGPLTEEAMEIMAVSKEIVPVDQGVLRASGDVVGINFSDEPDGYAVRFGYGGAASGYALLQHETPPSVFKHAEGKSWKYLERPVYEAAATMGPRLAGRISARFSQKLGGGVVGGGTFGESG